MKLICKSADSKARLNITKSELPCLDSSWHYHSQYELLYISKSNGVRFVGDSVSQFYPGDLVLVGPHLPHLWRNDASFYEEENTNRVEKVVVRFTKDFICADTFNTPEFSGINSLLEQSKFGLSFSKKLSAQLHNDLIALVDLSPAAQSIKLLSILCKLSTSGKPSVLSASDMRQYTGECSQRIDSVLKYVSDNYARNITLNEVADIACMTTNSFCRAFKRMTKKSFTQFLNEVRVRNASRMLVENKELVIDVSHAVGYESVESFRKWFKQVMGTTPSEFKQAI